MWLIKKFKDDRFDASYELIEVPCILKYINSNINLFNDGWRIFLDGEDVTLNAEKLSNNKVFAMMRTAEERRTLMDCICELFGGNK